MLNYIFTVATLVASYFALAIETNHLTDHADQPTLLISASDGSTISILYDKSTENLIFYAHVKIGTYIALGFGKTMIQTEIIQWAAEKSYYS